MSYRCPTQHSFFEEGTACISNKAKKRGVGEQRKIKYSLRRFQDGD
jgi:hypothetical protein